MPGRIKSVKAQRAEIGSFEKDKASTFFIYQTKEYDKDGQLTHETEYKPNGQKEMEIIYRYDSGGKLTGKQTHYPLEDTLENILYEYNTEGQKIKEENYFGDDLFERQVFAYNKKGDIISHVRTDDEGIEVEREEREYDDNGNLVKQTNTINNVIDRIIEFEYKDSVCVKETHTHPETGSMETVEYSYNDLGKRVKTITKDKQGNAIGLLEVEYDEKMNPVKYTNETSGFYDSKTINQVIYDDNSRVVENEYFDVLNNFLMTKEKYIYDDEGNIIEEEIFETNPMAGLKKTHYRLKIDFDFHE